MTKIKKSLSNFLDVAYAKEDDCKDAKPLDQFDFYQSTVFLPKKKNIRYKILDCLVSSPTKQHQTMDPTSRINTTQSCSQPMESRTKKKDFREVWKAGPVGHAYPNSTPAPLHVRHHHCCVIERSTMIIMMIIIVMIIIMMIIIIIIIVLILI